MRDKMGKYSTAWLVLSPIIFFMLIFFFALVFEAHAQVLKPAYSDDEIVSAIYKAEGGEKAKYPYGIRSVYCETKKECKEICKRTVRNNRRRYQEYGHRTHGDFISYLASRYCPTSGRNLTKAEKKLNGNWKKNVLYFLAKGRKQ